MKQYDYFGDRVTFLDKLRMKASLTIRRQIYDWFCQQLGTVCDRTILDMGSTPDTEHLDSNCFIRWLLADKARVLATSPEDISNLETVFPGVKTIAFPPQRHRLGSIDAVISSAVIEHTGSRSSQIQHIASLLELAPTILVTTPNRYHWLDFHTKLPLLHWLPRSLHRRLLRGLGMEFWSREENLNLLSETDLREIVAAALPKPTAYRVEWYRPQFLGRVSNLVVLIRERS